MSRILTDDELQESRDRLLALGRRLMAAPRAGDKAPVIADMRDHLHEPLKDLGALLSEINVRVGLWEPSDDPATLRRLAEALWDTGAAIAGTLDAFAEELEMGR